MTPQKVNPRQKDLLIGTLLGDGNLQTQSGGSTWRYRAIHAEASIQYLQHKYQVLENLCGSPPKRHENVDPRTKNANPRWMLSTYTQPCLRYYANLFYHFDDTQAAKGKKVSRNKFVKHVPPKIEKLLTPRAIAYWYMDDGSIKWAGESNAMRISTEGFIKSDVVRLRNALRKFNIEASFEVKRTSYNLYIKEEDSGTFRELIRPYLIDCMRYKVSDGNKGTL